MKLGRLVNILSGFAFDSSNFNEEGFGIPLIRIRNVSSGETTTFYRGDYDSKYLIRKGDLLIGMDGEFNLREWMGEESLLNQRVCKISSSDRMLYERYLYHFLPLALKQIEDRTNFVTVKHLSVKKIQDIEIPLPPLPVQKRIAEILDLADAYRQKTKALIDKYEELAQSIFLEMFGDPVTNPKGWEIGSIRGIVREVKYGTSSKAAEEGEYPYLRMNNIDYSGAMDYSDLKYITLPKEDYWKYGTQKGDVLFNRTNSKELVGKTGIVQTEEKLILAGYLIRLRVSESYSPYYLWAHLNSKWAKLTLFNMCKSIVGMANINAQEIQNMKIILPPKEIQDKFEMVTKKLQSQKEILKRELQMSDALFNSLLQKAFKGELVTEFDPEPIKELSSHA